MMESKKYVILWEEPDSYLGDDNIICDKKNAKAYSISEIPKNVGSKQLYKIGDNPPLSWKYVSMCGKCSSIEEF